jgi:hypothetical protein
MPPKLANSTYHTKQAKEKEANASQLTLQQVKQLSLFRSTRRTAWEEPTPLKRKVTTRGAHSATQQKSAPPTTSQITLPRSAVSAPKNKTENLAPTQAHSSAALPSLNANSSQLKIQANEKQAQSPTEKKEASISTTTQTKSSFFLPPIHQTRATFTLNFEEPSFSHLDSLKLLSLNGEVQFKNLRQLIQTEYSYWIPLTWPTPLEQRGHCCGLYALEMALRYANPGKSVPPARKNGDHRFKSLREVAKAAGFSAFGEIFNVNYLKRIADSFGFTTSTPLQITHLPYTLYKRKLCNLLLMGNSLIAACDLGGKNDTPTPSKGIRTHWALIFGFFYCDNECQLLVTQYGKYYLWSLKSLYESNFSLPENNPRSGSNYLYYKNPQTKNESFTKFDKSLSPSILSKARFSTELSLAHFQFTLLATPTKALQSSINLLSTKASEALLKAPQDLEAVRGKRLLLKS